MLNLHLLECTLKGYDHISDLLLAKYWVITGCKYDECSNLKEVYCYNFSQDWNDAFDESLVGEITLHVPEHALDYVQKSFK